MSRKSDVWDRRRPVVAGILAATLSACRAGTSANLLRQHPRRQHGSWLGYDPMLSEHSHKTGQSRTEYAVILLLVLVAVVIIVAVIGSHGNGTFVDAGTTARP